MVTYMEIDAPLPETRNIQSHIIWDVRVGAQKGYGLVVDP